MLARIYRLAAFAIIGLLLVCAIGRMASFASFFSLFGGMLLGWSLQAPVSGLAAWILVSLKRPFRSGDRIQLPSLGMVGDVKEIGAMYAVLDQVRGAIGSEEAIGRHILVPNAMLFGQAITNYTVRQDAAYMLDEVVVRITFDSVWDTAERILIDAARRVTEELIEAIGVQPYVRCDLYDYGVYMRLRYQTRVKNRAQIASAITRFVFDAIKRAPDVDIAIPTSTPAGPAWT